MIEGDGFNGYDQREICGIRIYGHGIDELVELKTNLFPLLRQMIYNGGGDTGCSVVYKRYKELADVYAEFDTTSERQEYENCIGFHLGTQDSIWFGLEDVNPKDMPGDIVVKIDSYLERPKDGGGYEIVEEVSYS
jgi:hypothetical protein